MSESWLEIIAVADEATAEAVAEALTPFAPHGSVVLEQLGDPHDLAPDALLPEVHVKIYVRGDRDSAVLREEVAAAVTAAGASPPTFRHLAEADWANAWREHYRPFRIGERFWIQPSWLLPSVENPDDIVLTLDPGMAFGTGLHATTQLCLELLEELVRPGMSLLDVGTGSGILAVGAAKLGASHIVAIDNDDLAVAATRGNAAANGVQKLVDVWEGTLADVEERPWDIVVVNILATIIIPLLRDDGLLSYVREDGYLVLSGIVAQQLPEVARVIAQVGGRVLETQQREDWVALVVQQKSTSA